MPDTEPPVNRLEIIETLENIITAIVDADGVSYQAAYQRVHDCWVTITDGKEE